MSDTLALAGGSPVIRGPFPFDDPLISEHDELAVLRCLRSKQLSMFTSKEVSAFEQELSRYCGASHCVLVTSCTAALHAALLAVGIGPGQRVAVPAYTYVATAMAVKLAGAEPVFIDIEAESLGLDSYRLEQELQHGSVDAIVIAHLFGLVAQIEQVQKVASRHGLPIVHDCAQAIGTRHNGLQAGVEDICCLSFGDSKVLKLGEGGAVVCNDPAIAERVRLVRHEGETWTRASMDRQSEFRFTGNDVIRGLDYVMVGGNYRPPAMVAALARSQLRELPSVQQKRQQLATQLIEMLSECPAIRVPTARPGDIRSFVSLPILLEDGIDRDVFLAAVCAEGVPAGVHFPTPLPRHSLFRYGNNGAFPVAEWFCKQHCVLPVYPTLSEHHIDMMVRAIRKVLASNELGRQEIKARARTFLEKTPLKDLCSGVYFMYDR